METPMMRSLPQSIEAEQSVIGAMIIDKSARTITSTIDFYLYIYDVRCISFYWYN